MELIFNELSISEPTNSLVVARERMKHFVLLLQQLFSRGLSKDLRVADDFIHLCIANEYKIIQWLNDQDVDLELKRFFKARVSRRPYIDAHNESSLYENFLSSEFKYKEKVCKGLGVAHLVDGIAISLVSGEEWDTHILALKFVELNSLGELFEDDIEIRHISDFKHLNLHKPFFEIRKRLASEDTEWRNNLEEIFPLLTFCDRSLAQLFEFGKGELILKQIRNRLFELNDYFTKWVEGGFDSQLLPFKVTPESQRTLDHYREEHTFLCPDGEHKTFSWHLRMTPGAGRIFFIPDEKTRKCIIGHIGNKLKTVNDPT
ncbi:hypothetical protein [Paenibacillus planticolens]|uniref:Uncharacterized protein n=1 Tax=Paenibacillus planticolens TaxID=2654976 RepID=A0ABX1ZPA3_9BACL|nr:hypothetical protein [Paenibacillus planticolens]NOV01919.1 hypothetical protein [Paenibacillus planticolens]